MSSAMIKCEICGSSTHSIQVHLREAHPGMTIAEYTAKFPTAPVLSDAAKAAIAAREASQRAAAPAPAPVPAAEPLVQHHAALHAVTPMVTKSARGSSIAEGKGSLREMFNLADTPEVRNQRGADIPLTKLVVSGDDVDMVPSGDDAHVWNIEDLKNQMMAIELNMPLYVWGHKGTGKTTDLEQICARTGRPLIRVQHTINTAESDIVGQMTIQNGNTVFEYGPLALAMLNGWAYLADEYDFAMPSVLAVYQPVLEGKALVIKEAPAHMRVVRPHKHFRFFATGNTNGSGDETGLYQGTALQNSANYDRFGMTVQKTYMAAESEIKIIVGRTGMPEKEAKKLVTLANQVREQFDNGKMSDTISTRALVNIANVGLRRGSMPVGIKLCFAAKLNKVDRTVVDGIAQRVYG